MPVGSRISYTARGTIDASAQGPLSNTATVTAPGGVTDPILTNNTAMILTVHVPPTPTPTATPTATPSVDLSITVVGTGAVAGATETYTIVVTNLGQMTSAK